MYIGGLQKSSLIDYPGKVSCVLFLSGCNFDCPYCHNPELARGCPARGDGVREPEIFKFLEKRKGLLDGVVISGGEPTLQEGIFALCKRIREMGYPVKLDTNGSRPGVIRRLLGEGLIDYIAMDIKTEPEKYPAFIEQGFNPRRLLESIRAIMSSGVAYEFRTTCVKPLVDGQVVEHIARLIRGAMRYALQAFHEREILHPEFFAGRSPLLERAEMMHLRSIAAPMVKECVVR